MAEEEDFFQPLKNMERLWSESLQKFMLFRISDSSFRIISDKY